MTVPRSQRVFDCSAYLNIILGEAVSNYAAKPASKNLAAIFFPTSYVQKVSERTVGISLWQ